MDILFTPGKIRKMNLKNRFICSATCECMASDQGHVTVELIDKYQKLAKGEIGLIITGHMFVEKTGRAVLSQTGIHDDSCISGLKKLVRVIHDQKGKIAFQLSHAGIQTDSSITGERQAGPSSGIRHPIKYSNSKQLSNKEILRIIDSYGDAAKRAAEAGADAVQIHAAHGYLIDQFLSPYFNRRKDYWGGSDENRFLFFRKVYEAVRGNFPSDKPVLVKMNSSDFAGSGGITTDLSGKYAKWMSELGVDLIEISCGTALYSYMNMCRGEVPVSELVKTVPSFLRHFAWIMLTSMNRSDKYRLDKPYNIDSCVEITKFTGKTPVSIVGGFRTVKEMTDVILTGVSDFISMSRPFIMQPGIVKKIKEKKQVKVSCVSCNRCLAAVAANEPVRCYYKKQATA